MSQKYQSCQWFSGVTKAFLFCSSTFLVLAIPTITELPGSKLLAQNVVSQDLEAASFFQQGVMRYKRKDLPGSEFALRQALQRDSNIAIARNYLGSIMLEQNRLEEAIQEYTQAIRLNPNFAEAYYNLGLALQKKGQPEAAITLYRQAVVINPTMASAQYNLGLALYEKGQASEAIAAYKQAVNIDNNNADTYFNLAIALQEEGQIEEAIAAYKETLRINPDHAVAYNNMGSLQAIQGQSSDAVATYQEAIRRLPNNPEAYYNLGVILYNQGEFKKANRAFKYARKRYQEQGNIEQANKIEQLIQQIAQLQEKNQPVIGQTPATQTPANANNQPLRVQIQELEIPKPQQSTPDDLPFSLKYLK